MKSKKSGSSKWKSFVAADDTNNVTYGVVLAISEALKAVGLNVTRVSLIQAGSQFGEFEELGSHEFLADQSFPKELPMQFFGDFQEPFFGQFNFGDSMEMLRNAVPGGEDKNLPSAVLMWLRQMYYQIYSVGNAVAGPTNTPSVPTVSADSAILEANPGAAKMIIDQVLPLLRKALAEDGGL